MQEKWRTYWYYAIRKTLRALLIWPPITGSFFLLVDAGSIHSLADLKAAAFPTYLYSYVIALSIAAVSTVMWAFATAGGPPYLRYFREKIWTHYVGSVLGVVIGCLTADALLVHFFGYPPSSFSEHSRSILLGSLISAAFVFFFAYRETRTNVEKLQTANSEANLSALRAQMHPHFLFNSLNSLTELIATDPKLAGTLTEKLADLYRMILSSSKEPTVSLSREVEVVKNYLAIESVRFGNRLSFQFDIPADCNPQIPSLLLQTLVENAVKHGISKLIAGGMIEIKIKHAHVGQYQFEIINDGPYKPKDANRGTGIKNSIERLTLLCGSTHNFQIENTDGNRTSVRFSLGGPQFA